MMKLRIILISTILGLLAACSQLTESTPADSPTASLPTVVALTGQALLAASNALTQSVIPTETPLPTKTLIPSTPLPTVTSTFEAGFTEHAQISFLSPGPMSSLLSPIKLQLMLVSGDSQKVLFDLIGEDGRLLQRLLKPFQHFSKGAYQSIEFSFEIRAVSEVGYIRISTKDKLGRIQALNTMPVLLYSMGSNQINPVGNMIYERTMLENVKDGDSVFGGVLNLKGRFWPFNDQPVFIELLLPDGEVLGSRILNFKGIDPESFETTLPYKVTQPTLARLTFRQDNPSLSVVDPDLKRNIYVYTMEVLLNP